MAKTVLVTGAAGFIGSHVAQALLTRGDSVVGIDNFNDYYDPARKRANLVEVRRGIPDERLLLFVEGDVRDRELVGRLFSKHAIDAVVHLAAMAGVRYSIEDPAAYYDVNLGGTLVILDAAVGRLTAGVKPPGPIPVILTSTSSVYGATHEIPFVEADPCGQPLAPYAASKRAAELLGYTYHHLYKLDFTALRLFNVYGPRGRPDMMGYKVADSISFDREVPLYNEGQIYRDWTYIGDIVSGIVAAVERPMGYEVINLGRGEPVLLADFVRLIEEYTGRKARLAPAPMPDSDSPYTCADITKASRLLGYKPSISVREGLSRFVAWYEDEVLKPERTRGTGTGFETSKQEKSQT